MDIAAVSSAASAANDTSVASGDRNNLIDSYDTFLKLLTAQLRYQSPLEPMDANQFTEQLVQYSSVEQAIKTNESLETLIAVSAANEATALVGYIGKTVTASGAATTLENGSASWTLESAGDASDVGIYIRNSAGSLVFSDQGSLQEGESTFVWDGRSDNGTLAPDGLYSMTVEARDDDGNLVDVESLIAGIVSGIDFGTTPASLLVGNSKVPISSLNTVQ